MKPLNIEDVLESDVLSLCRSLYGLPSYNYTLI